SGRQRENYFNKCVIHFVSFNTLCSFTLFLSCDHFHCTE
ncbi:unnamed protein product, partial [Tetraodon nigroviridis]